MTKAHKQKLAEGRRLGALRRREGMLSSENEQQEKKKTSLNLKYFPKKDGTIEIVFPSERKLYAGKKLYNSIQEWKERR
jgi:hypothetical protein